VVEEVEPTKEQVRPEGPVEGPVEMEDQAMALEGAQPGKATTVAALVTGDGVLLEVAEELEL
jgi:hypothetical protein